MQAVIQHFEGFQDMPPILAFIVEAFIQHVHDLVEVAGAVRTVSEAPSCSELGLLVEGQRRDLSHVGPCWTPWIVGGSCFSSIVIERIVSSWRLPLRTLTCTLLYPFVMFLTPLTTFDILLPLSNIGAVSRELLRTGNALSSRRCWLACAEGGSAVAASFETTAIVLRRVGARRENGSRGCIATLTRRPV